MVSTTVRQPPASASAANSGRKISVPVAVLAVSSPMTRPRWVTNQRLTMVAASTIATPPDARPDSTPQVAISSHGWVMKALRKVERAIRQSAPTRVRLTPRPCMRAAANGPTKP